MNETNESASIATQEPPTEAATPSACRSAALGRLTDAELDAKNARRLDLIDKEFQGGGLTTAETAELAILQPEVSAEIHARYHKPKHTDAELKAILDAIEKRLGTPTRNDA